MAAEVAYVGSEAAVAIFQQVKTVPTVHLWKSSESSYVVARRMSVCLVVINYDLACNTMNISVTTDNVKHVCIPVDYLPKLLCLPVFCLYTCNKFRN
jgi:hypothetical protein